MSDALAMLGVPSETPSTETIIAIVASVGLRVAAQSN